MGVQLRKNIRESFLNDKLLVADLLRLLFKWESRGDWPQ